MTTASGIPIFDGHNDTLLSLHMPRRGQRRGFFTASEFGHIDFPRARAGHLGGGFFAIFTPSPNQKLDAPVGAAQGNQNYAFPLAPPVEQTHALQFTMDMAALLFRIERESAGQAKVVRNADELEVSLRHGVFAMLFHIEGAEAIDTKLSALEVLYQAGLRSLGIVWSRANAFATGVPFQFPQSPNIGPGLTRAGRDLVRACNELGVMLDLSHLNEKGFWDVAKITHAPLVASHSAVYNLCQSARNLTDKQLDAIRATGGMVGVNYHVGFLRGDGGRDPNTPIDEIVRHVDYMVEHMGIDHVGLGSDFDGAVMPAELRDAAGLPKLMAALFARGYDTVALHKIAYANWLRVLRQTWKTAA